MKRQNPTDIGTTLKSAPPGLFGDFLGFAIRQSDHYGKYITPVWYPPAPRSTWT